MNPAQSVSFIEGMNSMLVLPVLVPLLSPHQVSSQPQPRSTWPPDVVPDPTCLPYDDSRVPDCRDYLGDSGEPVFIEHSSSKDC